MEVPHTKHDSLLQTSTLDQLLDQVDALVTAHEQLSVEVVKLNSELELAHLATREAQKRALRAETALSEQTTSMENWNPKDSGKNPGSRENENRREMPVTDSLFSTHLHPNQAIQALDREVIQELLNEVDSCIALLENK